MGCPSCRDIATQQDLTSLVKCFGYTPRNISPEDLTTYAQRSGAVGADQICGVKAQLLAGRLMYAKQAVGDCPKVTKINLGISSTVSKGLGVASTGIAAASSISLLATGGAGIGASAGGSGVLLGGLPAVIGTTAGIAALVAIPLAVWAAISAHHKIAVAREQATICDVTQAYNQWEDTVEASLVTGQMIPADVKAAILVMEPQLMQALQAIVKGGCDAACYFQKNLKALNLYAVEKLYDTLSPKFNHSNPANPADPGNPSNVSSKSALTTYGIAGAGAYGAVKVIGALV